MFVRFTARLFDNFDSTCLCHLDDLITFITVERTQDHVSPFYHCYPVYAGCPQKRTSTSIGSLKKKNELISRRAPQRARNSNFSLAAGLSGDLCQIWRKREVRAGRARVYLQANGVHLKRRGQGGYNVSILSYPRQSRLIFMQHACVRCAQCQGRERHVPNQYWSLEIVWSR